MNLYAKWVELPNNATFIDFNDNAYGSTIMTYHSDGNTTFNTNFPAVGKSYKIIANNSNRVDRTVLKADNNAVSLTAESIYKITFNYYVSEGGGNIQFRCGENNLERYSLEVKDKWATAQFYINTKAVSGNFGIGVFADYDGDPITCYFDNFIIEKMKSADGIYLVKDLGDGMSAEYMVSSEISLTEPTRDGYEFLGWYQYNTDGTVTEFGDNTIAENKQIFAHWAARIINQDFEAYNEYGIGEGYDADYEIHRTSSTDEYVYNGKTSIHRIGAYDGIKALSPFTYDIPSLSAGQKYTVSFVAKLEACENTEGKIYLRSSVSMLSPWENRTDWNVGTVPFESIEVAKYSDLSDGKWHRISYTATMPSPFIAIFTEGGASLYIDDFKAELVSPDTADGASVGAGEGEASAIGTTVEKAVAYSTSAIYQQAFPTTSNITESGNGTELAVTDYNNDVTYKIIYPTDAGDSVVAAGRLLYNHFKTTSEFGGKNNFELKNMYNDNGKIPVTLTAYSNAYFSGDTNWDEISGSTAAGYTDNANAILIGNTNRTASDNALKVLNERSNNANDFVIKVSNGDIAIQGGSTYALENGVNYFINKFCKGDSIKIPNNYQCVYRPQYSDIKISGVSAENYKVVMPKVKSYVEVRQAENLIFEISKATGYNLELVSDATENSAYEIVIGNTNRSSVPILSSKQYNISKTGNKIFVYGYDETALAYGIEVLMDEFKKEISAGDCLSNNISLTGVADNSKDIYSLAWNDEFNGNYTDNFSFRSYQKEGTVYTASNTLGNTVTYSRANDCIRIEDGKLIMEGKKVSDTEYLMPADLQTDGSFTFNYGYVEIKTKLPSGPGTFPAFWVCSDMSKYNTSFEIDIFESMGVDRLIRPDIFWYHRQRNDDFAIEKYANTHEWPNFNRHNWFDILDENESYSDEWHTIGLEKMPDHISIYYDGNLIFTMQTASLSTGELDLLNQFVQLRFSMPVSVFNKPDETTTMKWEIEYIRYYNLQDVGKISATLR